MNEYFKYEYVIMTFGLKNSTPTFPIIKTKEMIQFRKDILAYFVTRRGNPCDKGAKDFIEFNKIEANQTLKEISASHTEKGNQTNHFTLCIRGETKESISNIRENIV